MDIKIGWIALAILWPICSLRAGSLSTAMPVSVEIAPACGRPTDVRKRLPPFLDVRGRQLFGCSPSGVDYFYQIGTRGPVRAVIWDSAGIPIFSRPAGADSKLPWDVVTLTIYF
jgi:hypothetical protein